VRCAEGDSEGDDESSFYCEFEPTIAAAAAAAAAAADDDDDDDDDDAGQSALPAAAPASPTVSQGTGTRVAWAGGGGGGVGGGVGHGGAPSPSNDCPSSRTSQPRPIYQPPPPPRKGEHAEMVSETLAALNLVLLNGQHATALGQRDPEALGRALKLARDALLQLYTLEGQYAQQEEAVTALKDAGLGDLHEALTNAVLYGKYPLEHGVWSKLLDMMTNMYAESCFAFDMPSRER